MTQLLTVTDAWPEGSDCGTEAAGPEEHPHVASAQAARTTRMRVIVKVIADRLREMPGPPTWHVLIWTSCRATRGRMSRRFYSESASPRGRQW
jgi:hypothetical protein